MIESSVCTTSHSLSCSIIGALVELAVAPLESPLAPRRAQRFEGRAARGRRGAGGAQRGALRDRAVAIDAIEFDGGARLAVEFSGAVAVLLEVAVHALHSLFEMNVLEVRRPCRNLFGIGRRNRSCRLRRAVRPARSRA